MRAGNPNKVLEIALSKVEPVTYIRNGKWYGFLTPAEIIQLVKMGVNKDRDYDCWVPYYKEKLKKGNDNSQSCFHFTPNGELRELLAKKYPNHDERGH